MKPTDCSKPSAARCPVSKQRRARAQFTWDKRYGLAYVYIVHPIRDGEAAESVHVNNAEVVFDFDKRGKLLGIEFLRGWPTDRLARQAT